MNTTKYHQSFFSRIGEIVNERQRSPWLWPDLVFKATQRGKEHDECLKVIHGIISNVGAACLAPSQLRVPIAPSFR